jgi:hypothetical protein
LQAVPACREFRDKGFNRLWAHQVSPKRCEHLAFQPSPADPHLVRVSVMVKPPVVAIFYLF